MIAELPTRPRHDAQERHLRAEVGCLTARLRGADDAARAAEAELVEARAALAAAPRLDEVAEGFGLTAAERRVLLLLAGVELDGEVAELCAVAAGRPRSGAVTVGAVQALLPDAAPPALSPARPLRRWRLVEVGDGPLLASSAVRAAERLVHHLAGAAAPEPALAHLVRPWRPGELVAPHHLELAAAIAAEWEPGADGWPVVQLHGDDPDGGEDVAGAVAAAMGWALHVARADELPLAPGERERVAALWTRESILCGSALLLDAAAGGDEAAARLAAALRCPLLLAAPEPLALRRPARAYAVRRPGERERRALWAEALGPAPAGVLDAVGRPPLGARAIAAAAPAVRAALAAGRDPRDALRAGAPRASTGLEGLAARIEPVAAWDDLVLPDPALESLRAIAAQVRHRETVYDDWGFAAAGGRGLGITALFTGESGTGKTMAAEVLANDLGLDLHVIDLSAVVSKYIGETEKNLARVFDAAEDGAILLFDEADALFGKRTEVRDSHDRYANMEVSYLLQRMEAYRGLAVLTTNLRTALDRAFLRRLRFVVAFPFPDAGQRERIWRRVFPPGVPLGRLNWARLAGMAVAGGTIRTIAVNAAFLAAEDGGPVRTAHVLAAARGEYAKLDRPLTPELRP